MTINRIILFNFGSYEGQTIFDTHTTEDGKNIILVGGKNGAGKTTLFTAMRLCLYGYMSMGYKNYNSFYTRAIIKQINNSAKISRPTQTYIEMEIALNNGRDIDKYVLRREWILSDSLSEKFTVYKNSICMSDNDIADFEKFLLSLIPPELFNLYFFDGEKIADFFLEEGGNSRIKEAFLTLCGYDTFEIMRKNFKRISGGRTNSSPALEEYLSHKEALFEAYRVHQDIDAQLKQCIADIETCEADIVALEKDYHQKGGVTQEEWNKKLAILKEEEKKRESYNTLLKKWANDLIPFLMIRDQIVTLKIQLDKEANEQKYQNFCDVLDFPAIRILIAEKYNEIKNKAKEQFGGGNEFILKLSFEQSASLMTQISRILEFEVDKINKCKIAIKRSLALSAKIRQELDNSNVSNVQEYMQKRAQLFELKSALLLQRVELEQKIITQKDYLKQTENNLLRIQAQLEDELKKESISDISARAIIMLDKLQHRLYRQQIAKVESFFRKEIKMLMRKTRFIDDLYIDDDFNTHIYKNEDLEIEKLREALVFNSETQLESMFGSVALKILKQNAETDDWNKVCSFYQRYNGSTVTIPVEIDKMSLSNGEKQIFIMALYHSLVQLCNHEIPFIIDTPFARIDTEHRRNISKYFFSNLKGQIFILSTNEEINSAHVKIMREKIAATYMLENLDNKRTIVVGNQYFEV